MVHDIPNYVCGRSTPQNISIIETALWLIMKNLMQPDEIRRAMLAFETECKSLSLNFLPLSEKLVQESLVSINRTLPPSMFQMWCRKCWKWLMSATIKVQSGYQSTSASKKAE
jgi:hypothetical protein